MSDDTKKTIDALLTPMLKKTLFVAINRVAAPASTIEPFVAAHLAYMNAREAEGRLWATGPFLEEGVLVGDGLTILSTVTSRSSRSWRMRRWDLERRPIGLALLRITTRSGMRFPG